MTNRRSLARLFNGQLLRRAIWLALLSLLILPVSLFAQTPDNLVEIMLDAEESYRAGRFEQAVSEYETVIAAGVEHSTLYYNLGNAYLRQGDLGRAILNFRRAQRLDPRDDDIANNLDLARAQTVDKLQVSGLEQVDFGRLVGEWLTLEEMMVLLLALWFLICLSAGLYTIMPSYRRELGWLIIGWVGLLFLSAAAIGSSLYAEAQNPTAVVILSEVEVTEGPGSADEFNVNFALHAGTEVRIIDRRLGWRQIALPGDLNGWVPNNAIELVTGES
ncbi:MAG: tetratricopeptide repeat protein [Anaerolineae bacterium]|nr:tetratricopeptide repeat protein [Anaerolineae bacterium]